VNGAEFTALLPQYGTDCKCDGYETWELLVLRDVATQRVAVFGTIGAALLAPDPFRHALDTLASLEDR
jgi:hypothetical protein